MTPDPQVAIDAISRQIAQARSEMSQCERSEHFDVDRIEDRLNAARIRLEGLRRLRTEYEDLMYGVHS